MTNAKQFALDTDWVTAVVAIVGTGAFAVLAALSAWQLFGRGPWSNVRPELSWSEIVGAALGFWIAFGPGRGVPRTMRIFGFLLGADVLVHITIATAHVTAAMWSSFVPVDAWFHLLFWGAAFAAVIIWLKGKVRYV